MERLKGGPLDKKDMPVDGRGLIVTALWSGGNTEVEVFQGDVL